MRGYGGGFRGLQTPPLPQGEDGHNGPWVACILLGGYADATGVYGVGDIAEGDPPLEHTPIASPCPERTRLIATTGPLRANTRLAQPVVGV